MKKRMFFGLAGLAIMAAAVAATVASVNANSNDTDLLNRNLEALTSGESGNYSCCAPYSSYCSSEGSYDLPGNRSSYQGC